MPSQMFSNVTPWEAFLEAESQTSKRHHPAIENDTLFGILILELVSSSNRRSLLAPTWRIATYRYRDLLPWIPFYGETPSSNAAKIHIIPSLTYSQISCSIRNVIGCRLRSKKCPRAGLRVRATGKLAQLNVSRKMVLTVGQYTDEKNRYYSPVLSQCALTRAGPGRSLAGGYGSTVVCKFAPRCFVSSILHELFDLK